MPPAHARTHRSPVCWSLERRTNAIRVALFFHTQFYLRASETYPGQLNAMPKHDPVYRRTTRCSILCHVFCKVEPTAATSCSLPGSSNTSDGTSSASTFGETFAFSHVSHGLHANVSPADRLTHNHEQNPSEAQSRSQYFAAALQIPCKTQTDYADKVTFVLPTPQISTFSSGTTAPTYTVNIFNPKVKSTDLGKFWTKNRNSSD